MFAGSAIACAHNFGFYWNSPTAIDELKSFTGLLYLNLKILIRHGSDDTLVQLSSSQELQKWLVKEGIRDCLLLIQDGKGHCSDRNMSLDDPAIRPLDQLCKDAFNIFVIRAEHDCWTVVWIVVHIYLYLAKIHSNHLALKWRSPHNICSPK